MIAASRYNIKFIDIQGAAKETELKAQLHISLIMAVSYDEETQSFNVLTNLLQEQIGLYLFNVRIADPTNVMFYLTWKNGNEIDNVAIYLNRDNTFGMRELIVSYKQNYTNTHNLVIMDMGQSGNMVYKHESFALWEQSIRGFLVSKTKDFVTLSNKGLHITALGKSEKRQFVNNAGKHLMIHSLESYNFLKCDRENCIFFDCSQEE
jgi:hypothetical protein